MKVLFTRNITNKFKENPTPFYCKLCFIKRMIVVEDIFHVFFHCPRAYNLYAVITPILERLSGERTTGMIDLIFGKKIHDRNKHILYNYIIQSTQRAIWQARQNLEQDKQEIHAHSIFREIVFKNLCRQKVTMNGKKFYAIFGPILIVNQSPLGFRLSI